MTSQYEKSLHSSTSKKNLNLSTKEMLLSNDFDIFLKYKKIPLLFINHILLLLLSTYIIFSHQDALNDLVYQNRAVQSAFFFHSDDTREPVKLAKKYEYISSLPSFLIHLDNVINTIFSINNTLVFNITFDSTEPIYIHVNRMDFIDNSNNINVTTDFIIQNSTDNPIRQIGNDEDIRRWMAQVRDISIVLRYNCTVGEHLYQLVTLNARYNFNSRGIIKYDLDIIYSLQEFIFKMRYYDKNMILMIIQIILAFSETILIVKKIYFNLKVLLVIKAKFDTHIRKSIKSKENKDDNSKDYNNDDDQKSKWNQLRLQEKIRLIPKWYIFFLLCDLFQIMSAITFLSSSSFTPENIFFFGISSFLTWFSLGYYFTSHIRYSYIYDTLSQTFQSYSKILTVFAVLFTGFVLAHLTIYSSSIHWFNGTFNSFATLAAEVFADSYLLIWSDTIDQFPLRTVLLSFVMFVLFTGCHLRVMNSMTKEAFQHALTKKKFEKKEKISVEDYINREIELNEEEDVGDKNLFMDDIWIKAIVEKDDVNQILNFDVDKLNDNLYNVEQVKQYFHQKAKKIKKMKLSNEILKEIFSYDFNEDVLGLKQGSGKTESSLLLEMYNEIETTFKNLRNCLNGYSCKEEKKEKEKFLNSLLNKLNMIKSLLQ